MSTEEKIRLRTDEELALQNKGLQEIKHVLERLGVPYFLSSGTLLGAVREKNFIRWDWDVQCYLTTETAHPRKEEIRDAFISAGFTLVQHDFAYKSLKYELKKYGVDYEITAWWRSGAMRYRGRYSRTPARFFENPSHIEFLGETYPSMTPAEEYLEFCYGDWRTPKREADKSKYLNPQFYRYPMWVRRILEAVRNPGAVLRGIVRRLLRR